MELDLENLAAVSQPLRKLRRSRHSAADRSAPSLGQYDYLILKALQDSLCALIKRCPASEDQASALDLGASNSPYKRLLEANGYVVKTLDLDRSRGADYEGKIEDTGLADQSFDLVLCTEVFEHSSNPWQGIAEIRRILKPSGVLIVSAPHVWFYHPHPTDNWRFTQEGIAHLCRMGGLRPEALFSQGGSVTALFQILNFLFYGVMGRVGMPFYYLVNVLAAPIERAIPNTDFCLNFACLARK
jgi:SAM-dependent methyltransferase